MFANTSRSHWTNNSMLFREIILQDFLVFKGENRITFPPPGENESCLILVLARRAPRLLPPASMLQTLASTDDPPAEKRLSGAESAD
jgi:hypothetical protein